MIGWSIFGMSTLTAQPFKPTGVPTAAGGTRRARSTTCSENPQRLYRRALGLSSSTKAAALLRHPRCCRGGAQPPRRDCEALVLLPACQHVLLIVQGRFQAFETP